MRQAVVARSTAGRVCDNAVSIHVSNSPRFQPVAASSRRSILLGLAAGVAGLAYDAKKARAAAPLLSDLVRPLAESMDKNGDGELDVEEFRGALLQHTGITVPREAVVRDVMARADFNDDAVVSVDEFARGMALELEVNNRWMEIVERDGSDEISLEELQRGLGDLGERGRDVIPAAFRMVDKDRNRRLSKEEAQNAMDLIASALMGEEEDDVDQE